MGSKNRGQPEHGDSPSWEEEPEPPRHHGRLGGLRPFSMRKKIVAMGVAYFTLFFLICSAIAPTVIDHLATLNLIHTETDQDQENSDNNTTPAPEMTLAEADFRALDDLESLDSHWYWYQDGTGTRIMAWPATFKWPGASPGVLSTGPNDVDLLVATYRAATGFWYATLLKDFS